jgi:hypothetical protein
MKKQHDREKIGLTDPTDIKDALKDPTLAYVEKPAISTKVQLEQKRRQENYEEFKKTELK